MGDIYILLIVLVVVIALILVGKYIGISSIYSRIQGSGNYDDLKCVRGTNSSVFLSCYKEQDGWYLMSKGYQIRNGFVPMRETVDPGIISLFGVNIDYISLYPPSKIADSAQYAKKIIPYDPMIESDGLMLVLNKAEKYAGWRGWDFEYGHNCELMILLFYIMRLKQYYGYMPSDLWDYIKSSINKYNCVNSEIQILNDALLKMASVEKVLKHDLSKYEQQYKDGDVQTRTNIEEQIRAELGLHKGVWEEGRSKGVNPTINLNINYFYKDTFKTVINMADLSTMDGAMITHIIRLRIMHSDQFTPLIPGYLSEIERNREWIVTVKQAFLDAVNEKIQPKYALIDEDIEILQNPIPLLFASTVSEGELLNTRTKERGFKDKIIMGPDGMDVVYVKSEDYDNLVKLLNDRDIVMDVRVDDKIFG